MSFKSESGRRAVILSLTVLLVQCWSPAAESKSKPEFVDSPLSPETQSQLLSAGRYMKSGKHDKAKPILQSALQSATDVPKCLAIAQFTEAYGFPMLEIRRQCCNKALSLCNSEEDLLLMALKARRYEFFEITRESISKLIENAKTVPQLYNLAKKSQEVSLNDVSHLAMEKAFTGIKNGDQWTTYAENCKALGFDDLLRKAIKLVIDEEDESIPLCEIALRVNKYGMRDEIRYALKKALDKVSSDLTTATHEMAEISDTARQLNEPDVKSRADFFVKKGNYMLKQRGMQEEATAKERAERERSALDSARLRDSQTGGFQQETSTPQAPPEKPSSGY